MTYLRIMSIIAGFAIALSCPLWLFVLFALFHAFCFSGYDLLPFSVLIDASFGERGKGVWYAYSAVTASALLISIYLRPYLRMYA